MTSALAASGSSLFTLGFSVPRGGAPEVIVCIAAATGLVIISLQIAYLPTLYGAFNRRETEVALLNARAGVPSWGPELLARTHYALGSGVSTLDTLPDLYAPWERWAADVAESHTTYLPLVRFRSPKPLVLGDRALVGARLRRAVPRPVTACRSSGTGAPVPAQRLSLFQPDRAGHGVRHPRRARPQRTNQPHL